MLTDNLRMIVDGSTFKEKWIERTWNDPVKVNTCLLVVLKTFQWSVKPGTSRNYGVIEGRPYGYFIISKNTIGDTANEKEVKSIGERKGTK